MDYLVIDLEMNFWNSMNIKKKRAPRLSNSCTVTNPFLCYRILLYLMINVNCIRRSRRNMTSSCTSMVSEVQ